LLIGEVEVAAEREREGEVETANIEVA